MTSEALLRAVMEGGVTKADCACAVFQPTRGGRANGGETFIIPLLSMLERVGFSISHTTINSKLKKLNTLVQCTS